jgi:cytosine/adenosine deaminase-related metal-dependent hydrolase
VIYRADWVLPIAGPPLAGGWVAVEDGRVTGVGGPPAPSGAVDLRRMALLPALVNAHTHLELSHLHHAVPPAARMVDWVRDLLAVRRAWPDPDAPAVIDAARAAITASLAAGTGLVGEVSNTLATVPLLAEAGMPAQVFHELLGFGAPDAAALAAAARARLADVAPGPGTLVRLSLAPHAPYSVSPALFAALATDLEVHGGRSTVHLAESPEEVEFLARGTGPWRTLLEDLGAWNDAWRPPGVSPVAYLADLGALDGRVAAVHATQCTGGDLDRLRALGVPVVACPRSNQHVGVGVPPLEAFYAMGVTVALGTDSLASVETLSVFDELAEARRLAPRVPAGRLLESATVNGARALGFADVLGTLETGRLARLIAVRVPEGAADVEEYLVSGVGPSAIEWLEAATA